jgi:PKD repeat protein
MKSLSKLMIPIVAVMAISLAISCGEDDPKVEPPKAIFDFVVNANRSGQVSFTSESIGADSYAWDFGDDEGTSTEENPSYTYEEEGTYTVTLTVTNGGGQNSASLEVEVFIGAAELIKDGDMSKASSWNTRQLWVDPDNAVLHTFKDGAFFMDNAPGTNWSNFLLWQEVAIEANKEYAFSADVKSADGFISGTTTWFEVHFSKEVPPAGTDKSDYSPTVGGLKQIRLNFNQDVLSDTPFDGKLQVLAQSEANTKDLVKHLKSDGKFTLTADELTSTGTIYVSFKIGTANNSENFRRGMTLDNVSIKEVLK